MKLWHKILVGITGLIIIDQALTHYADYRIRSRDADFPESYKEVRLDWNGDYEQGCSFQYELWIYPYQTCFLVQDTKINQRAFYTYNKPRPRLALLFRGDSPENYYFQEITGRNYWKSFNEAGTKINDYSEQHDWR